MLASVGAALGQEYIPDRLSEPASGKASVKDSMTTPGKSSVEAAADQPPVLGEDLWDWHQGDEMWDWQQGDIPEGFEERVAFELGEVDNEEPPSEAVEEDLITLNPKKFVSLELVERIEVSHDCRVLRFALPSPKHVLGLPVGKHVYVKAKVGGVPVMRAYTPVTGDETPGHVDFLVKVYFPTKAFPQGGKMSGHLDTLRPGDFLEMKGPAGHIEYIGEGRLKIKKGKTNMSRRVRDIGLVAGGSGITPVWQVLRAALEEHEGGGEGAPKIHLITANRHEEDIMMRQELEEMQAKHPRALKITWLLSRPPEGWPHATGRVSKSVIEAALPAAGELSTVLLCGPDGMVDNSIDCLGELGWDTKDLKSCVF